MTFILTRDGLAAKFQPSGEYMEITTETRQEIICRVEECYDEWHGLSRPTGELRKQIIHGKGWTSVAKATARQIWKEMISQGWQPA
jgi:hypothetical protein